MLSAEEEQAIRESVRRSLSHILREPTTSDDAPSPVEPDEIDRLTEAKRIISEETERYYQQLGRVKHVSRSGQVFWVTQAEQERLSSESRRRRHRRRNLLAQINSRIVLVWAVTILVGVLMVVFLLTSPTIAALLSG